MYKNRVDLQIVKGQSKCPHIIRHIASAPGLLCLENKQEGWASSRISLPIVVELGFEMPMYVEMSAKIGNMVES